MFYCLDSVYPAAMGFWDIIANIASWVTWERDHINVSMECMRLLVIPARIVSTKNIC